MRSRRLSVLAIAALLMVAVAGSAYAASIHGLFNGNAIVKLKVDGKEVTADIPSFIMDGRTMIPARFLAEALGATVSFDANTYTVNVTSKKTAAPAGTREGFVVTDKNVGFLIATPTLKRESHTAIASNGNKFLSMMLVVKNFSDQSVWISPEDFKIVAGGKKYEYASVTFNDTARLIPKTLKPGEMGTGVLIFEVPDNSSYTLLPGQTHFGFNTPVIPVVPVE